MAETHLDSLSEGGPLVPAASLWADIAGRAAEIEAARRLPADLAQRLAAAGLFKMLTPRVYGGGEVELADALAALEHLGRADGSVAWCVMVASTTGQLAAHLPETAAREIFGDPGAIVAGVAAPRGYARREGQGYRVSGEWPWASGSQVCTWLIGGCRTDEGTGPRVVFFPARSVCLIDDWQSAGLKGTGSGRMQVRELTAPLDHGFPLAALRRDVAPLYRLPPQLVGAQAMAAVALGVAAGAADDFRMIAADRAARDPSPGYEGVIQALFAEAVTRQRAARALLFEDVRWAMEEVQRSGSLSPASGARMRLTASYVARTSAETCRLLQDRAGGDGVYLSSPIQRRLRDAQTITAHGLVSPRWYAEHGRGMIEM